MAGSLCFPAPHSQGLDSRPVLLRDQRSPAAGKEVEEGAPGPESSQQEPRFLCKAEQSSPTSCVGAQGGLVSHSLPPWPLATKTFLSLMYPFV